MTSSEPAQSLKPRERESDPRRRSPLEPDQDLDLDLDLDQDLDQDLRSCSLLVCPLVLTKRSNETKPLASLLQTEQWKQ
ncbi:hypothetical protein INR49_006704 [Caranx melampygus]|nr:hypothetical protein INR49_006704 [Caranx melampygus]